MEDWPTDLLNMLEELADDVARELEQCLEQCLESVSDNIADTVGTLLQIPEEIFELLDEATGRSQEVIFPENEELQWGQPDPAPPVLELQVEETEAEAEIQETEETEQEAIHDFELFFTPVVPTAEKYPACIGCKNYHGYVYGGNIVVCGIHPYGWHSEDCPDWEGI